MRFKTGDIVVICEGELEGKLAEVQRYDGSFCVVKPENVSYEVFCYDKHLRLDVFVEPKIEYENVIKMPTPRSKFEHKHQIRWNGNFLEFTHKELKELSLLIKGLLNE